MNITYGEVDSISERTELVLLEKQVRELGII